jgi:hypothetical protein
MHSDSLANTIRHCGIDIMRCWCYNCLNKVYEDSRPFPMTAYTFIVCPTCGNKRCPRSTDHNLECTNSNEPGQKGSRYEQVQPLSKRV